MFSSNFVKGILNLLKFKEKEIPVFKDVMPEKKINILDIPSGVDDVIQLLVKVKRTKQKCRFTISCDGRCYTTFIDDEAVPLARFANRLGFVPMKPEWPWNFSMSRMLSTYPMVMSNDLNTFQNYLVKVVQVTK